MKQWVYCKKIKLTIEMIGIGKVISKKKYFVILITLKIRTSI
jgi:hypothetical protein